MLLCTELLQQLSIGSGQVETTPRPSLMSTSLIRPMPDECSIKFNSGRPAGRLARLKKRREGERTRAVEECARLGRQTFFRSPARRPLLITLMISPSIVMHARASNCWLGAEIAPATRSTAAAAALEFGSSLAGARKSCMAWPLQQSHLLVVDRGQRAVNLQLYLLFSPLLGRNLLLLPPPGRCMPPIAIQLSRMRRGNKCRAIAMETRRRRRRRRRRWWWWWW